MDRRSAGDDAEPLARARSPADRRAARSVDAADHRPARDRRALPDRARRSRHDPRRLRHRQDRAPAVAGEMGARRRRRLRRLRRARQRADRGAPGVPAARRPAQRGVADGAHDPDREHVEHAGGRARSVDLHGDHAGGVLPRPGLSRRADGRLDQPLGRGAARGLEPARGDARRGGLSRLPVVPAGRVLRASRSGPVPRVGPARRVGDRSSAPSRRRAATSPSRSPSTRCGSRARSGRSTRPWLASATSRRSTGTAATRSTSSPAGSSARSPPTGRSTAPGCASCSNARPSSSRSCSCSAPTRSQHPSASCCATGRLLREDFLQQSAFDELDAYCAPHKQLAMLRAIRSAHTAMSAAVDRGATARGGRRAAVGGRARPDARVAGVRGRGKRRRPDRAHRARAGGDLMSSLYTTEHAR